MFTKKLLSLTFLLFLFLFTLLCDNKSYADENITFYENEDVVLYPFETITYQDNTIVFRLVKILNEACHEPHLMFRILYPNGTSNFITIQNHTIPPDSFCFDENKVILEDRSFSRKMRVFESIPNYILLIYSISDTNVLPLVYGMMIEWNGNVKSNTFVGRMALSTISFNARFYKSDKYEYWSYEKLSSSDMKFINFQITYDGDLKTREIPFQYDHFEVFEIFSTIDYGILCVSVHKSTEDTNPSLLLEPKWRVYGLLMREDTIRPSERFLIFQTAIQVKSIIPYYCLHLYDGKGFYCLFSITDALNNENSLQVTFLSNGRIKGTKLILANIDLSVSGFDMLELKFGGFMIVTLNNTETGCNITYYSFEVNMDIPTTHSENLVSCTYCITNNGTLLRILELKVNNLTASTKDLSINTKDRGYNNYNIDRTEPTIDGIIELGRKDIQINYTVPINTGLSNSQSISIFQKFDDNNDILREKYSAQSDHCSVLENNTTLSLKISSCAFNQPNSTYYIIIDTGFVIHRETLEPLLGIYKDKWKFKTVSQTYNIDDSTTGFLRLTDQGTSYFENLSLEEKTDFIQNLTIQLARIIPVRLNRIRSDNKYQKDTKNENRMLINIKILEPNNSTELSVSTIVENLNTLVQNKDANLLSFESSTSMLDSEYGFQKYSSFLNVIQIPIIVMAAVLFVLIICYMLARKRYKEGRNLIILPIAFNLYDFVMDLLFIFELKNKNLPFYFHLSLIWTFLPMTFNLLAAFYIISYENSKNPEFHKYLTKNTMVTAICTVVSGAEIEILYMLSSKFAGLNIFIAPFSKEAERYIFWCAFVGLCFEDIPQFGVQIAYNTSRVEYTTISALTLISNVLSLLINVVQRLYLIIIECRNPSSRIGGTFFKSTK